MKTLRNLFEDAKKLSKVNKRTRKSFLKNIKQLNFEQQVAVIIWFTEFEPKIKLFKKFKKIIQANYSLYDLIEASCFTNLFLVYPKKQTIDLLSSSEKGLNLISKIYKTFNFLSSDEKIRLFEAFCVKNIENNTLEKETGLVWVDGKIQNAHDVLKRNSKVDENLLKRCSASTLFKFVQELQDEFDAVLAKTLIVKLFEEGNYDLLNAFVDQYKEVIFKVFDSPGESLQSIAIYTYFKGNDSTDSKILKLLANSYDKSIAHLKDNLTILRQFKYPKFRLENLRKYVKENIWVVEFLSKFLNLLRTFLPEDFLNILIVQDIDFECFYTLIDAIGYKFNGLLEYNERFYRVAMRSNRFKKFMLIKGMAMLKEDDRVDFISKFTKREDFEFYLTFLADEENVQQFKDALEVYKHNKIAKQGYTGHMKMYKAIKSIRTIVKEGNLANESNALEMNCKQFFRSLEQLNIEESFGSCVGICFLKCLIQFCLTTYETLFLYRTEADLFIDKIFLMNKKFKVNEINKQLWEGMFDMPEMLIKRLEGFIKVEDELLGCVVRNEKCDCQLKELEKYEFTPFKSHIVRYISRNFSLDAVLDEFYAKYEDERDFYYECILEKVKNEEFDSRIVQLPDSPWLDKIFDEIFTIESNEIFELLRENRPEFLFDYSFRHQSMRKRYLESIDREKCTKEEALEVYSIIQKDSKDSFNCENGSLEWKCATLSLEELEGLEVPIVELLYLLAFIRPEDGKFFSFKNIKLLLELVESLKKHQNEEEQKQKEMLDFIFSVYLKDKYFVYVIWDFLINCLKRATQTGKYLLLKNFEDLNASKDHIEEFLNLITSMLHDTNTNICIESKRLLNNIVFTSPEMLALRSQLIQCLIDKIYVKPFFETLYIQTFNHFICLNSLTLLIQVLRIYIREYKDDVLFIFQSLPKIVKPSDLHCVMPSIYNILSKFVIDYQFYTNEVVKTIVVLLKYSKNVNFSLLVDNIDVSLSVGCCLVKTLSLCEVDIQRDVINRVIKVKNGIYEIPNNFLAYAPELPVFKEYISHFISLLQSFYESEDYEKRKIAFNAFERIEITDYLIETALKNNWTIRLNTLELFLKKNEFSDKELSIVFILRHDPHSVVRKKAYDLWKMNVENPNKKLKDLYLWIFEYIRFIEGSNSLRDAIGHTISEIVTKYNKYIEEYVTKYFIKDQLFDFSWVESDSIVHSFDKGLSKLPYIDVVEVLLLESSKQNKLLDLVFSYSSQFISTKIYKVLLDNPNYKDRIIDLIKKNIEDKRLEELVEHSGLAFDLYKTLGNSMLLKSIGEAEKMKLIKSSLSDHTQLGEIFINVDSTLELEEFIINCDANVQYLYLLNIKKLVDFGNLQKLFNKVFIKMKDEELQKLIVKKNFKYILDVSYKNITNFDRILCLLLQTNTLRSIERINEILEYCTLDYLNSVTLCKFNIYEGLNDSKNYEIILGFLLLNNLYYENRAGVKEGIKILQSKIKLCEYKEIIKRAVLA